MGEVLLSWRWLAVVVRIWIIRSAVLIAMLACPAIGLSAEPLWSFDVSEKITSTACVTKDAVYVTTWQNQLIALDRQTGSNKRWQMTLDGHIPRSATFHDGTLYVASYRGKLYAIDPETGKEKWIFDNRRGLFYTKPVVSDGVVYIGDRSGKFFAIDVASGKELNQHKSINWVMGSACVEGNTVYLGRMDWWIYAYRAKTLEVLWRYKTRTSVLSTPVVDEKKLYCGSDDGNLYALDKNTGRQDWRFQTAGWVQCCPTLYNGCVLFSSFDGAVYCLETGHGRPLWHFRTEGEVSSSVVIDSDRCYFGSRDCFLYCLDVATGELKWRFDSGSAIVGSPAIRDGIVYCTTTGGRVFAIDTKKPPTQSVPMGEPNWAKVPPKSQIENLSNLTTTDRTHILFLDLAELEKVEGLEAGTPGTWDAVKAMYYGDIHRDPATGKWQMWYTGGEMVPPIPYGKTVRSTRHIGYATSTDGLHWNKPDLGLIEYNGSKHNNIVALDGHAPNVINVSGIPGAKSRWRMYTMSFWGGDGPGPVKHHIRVRESDDCMNWKKITRLAEFLDVSTIILDRDAIDPKHRFKAYGQCLFRWPIRLLGVATSEDGLDWARAKIFLAPDELGVADSEDHYLGVTRYGDYYIALYDAMYSNHSCATEMAVSRDGLHFSRVFPGRKFIPLGNFGDYDSSMITISAGFVTTAEKHYQYYAASRMNYQEGVGVRSGLGQPWRRTMGLRVWRRDGFTSLRVPIGGKYGTLLTRPLNVKDTDKHKLVLNIHVPNCGTVSVSVLDAATGKLIPGYQKSDQISGIDRINHVVTFGSRSDLSGLAGVERIQLRISLSGTESQIYSIGFL